MKPQIRQPIVTVAGHVDHGKCVSGDTLIPLVDGTIITAKELFEKNFKEKNAKILEDGILQDVKKNNLSLFSYDGERIINKNISHIWKKESKNLIKIKIASGDIIKTTPEHPFFVFGLDGLIEKRADLIKNGDSIAVPKKINIKNSDIIDIIIKKIRNLDNFICFLNPQSEIFFERLKKFQVTFIEKKLNVSNILDSIKKKRFRIIDFFNIADFIKISEKEAYSMIYSIKNSNKGQRKGHTSNSIRFFGSNPEWLGYVLGCLAGDGYIGKSGVVLNNNDLDIQESYKNYLKVLFDLESKTKQAHTCQIVVNNGGKTFSRFLFEVIGFPVKNKSAEMDVPEIAKKNMEVFKGFFSGLFDTDGYVSNLNHCIEITSKSKKMIKECSIILLNFGIHSSVYEKNGFYNLKIANKIYLNRFLENFNPRLKRKLERIIKASIVAESSRIFDFVPVEGKVLNELKMPGKINKKIPFFTKYKKSKKLSIEFLKKTMDNIKNSNETSKKISNVLSKELSFVEVISKEEIKNEEGHVYDFTISETHNFVAEKILIHNTTILDNIRKTSVYGTEAGGITQKISFTKVPIENIKKRCPLINEKGLTLEIPGFLFIDTPGHAAFSHLRKRGGSLADLAILVIDINEGIMPQTAEVIEILKMNKVPFIIALNKLDNIFGWRKQSEDLVESIQMQSSNTKLNFDEKLYTIIGSLHHHGFNAKPFYEVKDFTTQLALVPCSGKTGEGINELIMMLCGLSQKFLRQNLQLGKDAKGVILEIKKERTMQYIEAILYDGILSAKDEIAIASFSEPIISKIRVLEEILPASDKFKPVYQTTAANGIRMQLINSKGILPGMPFIVFKENNLEEIKKEFEKEIGEKIQTDEKGIVIKADSLGSLEALTTLLRQAHISIVSAGIGLINKKDLIQAEANLKEDPANAIVVAFNTDEDEEVKAMEKEKIKILKNDVIYRLIEDLIKFQDEKRNEIKRERMMGLSAVCRLKILHQYVFRNSNPAVFGIAVEAGKVKPGIVLMDEDGEAIAKVKGLEEQKNQLEEATRGMEVAMSLPGITFDRQLKDKDYLYSDISESQFRNFKDNKDLLTADEIQTLQKIAEIKRKTNPNWGI